VQAIYGTTESVVPWLCNCPKIAEQTQRKLKQGTFWCHAGCCEGSTCRYNGPRKYRNRADRPGMWPKKA
jgi:hypothetical protein